MSSGSDMYTQCLLRRISDGEFLERVAWIPSCFAKLGKNLVIDSYQWKVTATFASKPYTYVNQKSRDHLEQREASDV